MTDQYRTPITFEQLEAKVREIVAANPTYVYVSSDQTEYSCVYNGTPDQSPCIFGRAFAELGYPVFGIFEGTAIEYVMKEMLTGPILRESTVWAVAMQAAQDTKHAWTKALAHADEQRQLYLQSPRQYHFTVTSVGTVPVAADSAAEVPEEG